SETDPNCKQKRQKDARTHPFASTWERGYFASAAGFASSAFLRLSQLYFFWNFSTRPVVSTNFILPVKNGWHAEQISVLMALRVLRVVNLLPQPQVTVASSYLGWMSFFMALLFAPFVNCILGPAPTNNKGGRKSPYAFSPPSGKAASIVW